MSIRNLPEPLQLIFNENQLSPCSDLEIIQFERQKRMFHFVKSHDTFSDFLAVEIDLYFKSSMSLFS